MKIGQLCLALVMVMGLAQAADPMNFTAPQGGEAYCEGQPQTVRYSGRRFKTIKADLSRDGGKTWECIGVVDPASNKLHWMVSGHSATCCVRLTGTTPTGKTREVTSNSFSIVSKATLAQGGDAKPQAPQGDGQGQKGDKGDKGDRGEKGDTGAKGDHGDDGSMGSKGDAGKDGSNGSNGRDGASGKDGTNGSNGRDGHDGKDGLNGAPGGPGKDGRDGLAGNDGTAGKDGRDGAVGPQGPAGPADVGTLDQRYVKVPGDGMTGPLSITPCGGTCSTLGSRTLQLNQGCGSHDAVYGCGTLQLKISNGQPGQQLDVGMLDNGQGVVQAQEVNVGYTDLLLNPICGNVGIGTGYGFWYQGSAAPRATLHVNNSPTAGNFLPEKGKALPDIAVFSVDMVNKARIDNTGKCFFNGGLFNGGIEVTTTTGNAGSFSINNATSASIALNAGTNGPGEAVRGENSGTGQAASFVIANATSASIALSAGTNGSGPAIRGENPGTGQAATFNIINAANASTALNVSTNGTGDGLKVSQDGTSGNIATFVSNSANKARIDKAGKGFFNGGTQSGGADVAEAISVLGDRSGFSPGDVLALSPDHPNRFALSATPYSRLVSGVYATKPGVLLTERDATNDDLMDLVPMGVVGIIPTKVCGENGPIQIGDLLVSSSTPGRAMRGTDESKLVGAVIGKAMEAFDGKSGAIRVLVSVK